jgi:ribonuclease HII
MSDSDTWQSLYRFDAAFMARNGGGTLAGVDEAGRGPLAGPVVAAAVILGPCNADTRQRDTTYTPGTIPADTTCVTAKPVALNDSKKLSAVQRKKIFRALRRGGCIYAVAAADAREIDRRNILQATLGAMMRALEKLPLAWDHALIDGTCALEHPVFGHKCSPLVKGDSTSAAVAAASIVAKQTRDRLMHLYHHRYPQYGFDRHVGYGTKMHREALQRCGMSPVHRRSFCTRIVAQTELCL